MTSSRKLGVRRLGVVGYAEGLELQKALVAQRVADEIDDTLLLLQHPHVLTLGVKAGESRNHDQKPRPTLSGHDRFSPGFVPPAGAQSRRGKSLAKTTGSA